MKAVKGSPSIRTEHSVWTTSPLHSYIIAHSVCALKHATLAPPADTNLIIRAPLSTLSMHCIPNKECQCRLNTVKEKNTPTQIKEK